MDRPPVPEEEDLRRQLAACIADRRSPEARALFEVLGRYTHRRVGVVSRHCGQALAESEQEEVVGEVLLQLMQGALATFRGRTLPELLAFVRTVADRTAWRTIRRRDRERALLQRDGSLVEDWTSPPARPDANVEIPSETPLAEADRRYLLELLSAGSKAEHARRSGVSRAAVTQRLQRIQARVAELSQGQRASHEAWLQQAARAAVEAEEPFEPVEPG